MSDLARPAKVLSEADVKRILAVTAQDRHAARNRSICMISILAGLRASVPARQNQTPYVICAFGGKPTWPTGAEGAPVDPLQTIRLDRLLLHCLTGSTRLSWSRKIGAVQSTDTQVLTGPNSRENRLPLMVTNLCKWSFRY